MRSGCRQGARSRRESRSGVLLAAHQLFGLDLTMESSHGSQNLDGGAAGALAVFSTLLQVAAVIAVWVWYARGQPIATGSSAPAPRGLRVHRLRQVLSRSS